MLMIYFANIAVLIIGGVLTVISAFDAMKVKSNRASTIALISSVVNFAGGETFFSQINA